MNQAFSIRLVTPKDASDMLDIYGPVVLQTATSFETKVPSKEDFIMRIEAYSSKSPWLVAVFDGKVVVFPFF